MAGNTVRDPRTLQCCVATSAGRPAALRWPLYWVWWGGERSSWVGAPPVPAAAQPAGHGRTARRIINCYRLRGSPMPRARSGGCSWVCCRPWREQQQPPSAHISPLKPRPLMPPPLSPGTCRLPMPS